MLRFAADAAPSAWSRFVEWFSGTLLGELLVYLKTKYFSVHLGSYEHLASGRYAERNLEWILFALFLGAIVAAIASVRYKRLASRFLLALQSAGASAPESAKTLEELGVAKSGALRRMLARPTPLSRLTQAIRENGEGKNEPIPALTLSSKELLNAKFFLATENLETLLPRCRQKGHPALILAITIVVSIVALALVMRFLPAVLGLLDAIL